MKLTFLGGYPPDLLAQTADAIRQGTLGPSLLRRYPEAHEARNDAALRDYVMTFKNQYLRSTPPLSHIGYDNRLHVIRNALGTHATISRVQGAKLKSRREIRIASLFRTMPEVFLRMIVVHELAHLRERDHDKAFYQLCRHMAPDYHQLEYELRAYLCWLEITGEALWT
ncbi:M48 metallopeptidase family protein [Viridibacterium curvum]|uniref:DUF45 domain-containing protein n=1 Tax=Viridibacterium curvum TaxID=1101404 RepID=A0ABP9Q8K7_9RHOO